MSSSFLPLNRQAAQAPILPSGGYIIAVDTAIRTYLTFFNVTRGAWNPIVDGFPQMQQWLAQGGGAEYPLQYTAYRMQPFTPGTPLTQAQIQWLLPQTQLAATNILITAPPYNALPAPADSTAAIQAALTAAGLIAGPGTTVDVVIPTGTWNYSSFLSVPAYVRLRAQPGGILNSTNQNSTSVTLTGNGSGALFLTIQCNGTSRASPAITQGITIGGSLVTPVSNTIVVGNEVIAPRGAHIFAQNSQFGMVAFNYAHDGYADTYHHTGKSSFCQVVGNRSFWPSISVGDDMFAFVSYVTDGDLTHHCTCLANWGRNTPARQMSCVGGAYIFFDSNNTAFSNAAGGYIAQESGFNTYGVLNCTMQNNTIDHANVNLSHAGILAYASIPTSSSFSPTFGTVSNMPTNTVLFNNLITNVQPGILEGEGISVRSSCVNGEVVLNVVIHAPLGILVNGTGFIVAGNSYTP